MIAASGVHLGVWKQPLDGVRHHVLCRVADHVARVGVAIGHDLEGDIFFEGLAEVDEAAIDAPGDRGLGEARADLLGSRENRRAMGHRQRLPVG